MHSPSISIHFLGSFELTVAGTKAPVIPHRGQLLLLKLVLSKNGISRETLSEALWSDVTPERARFYLRRTLTELRKALGIARTRLRDDAKGILVLQIKPGECDISVFRESVRSKEISGLELAAAVYDGPLFVRSADLWVELERESLRAELIGTLLKLAAVAETNGEANKVKEFYGRAIMESPYDETLLRSMMQCLARMGEFPEITRIHHQARVRFQHDLQLPLSLETERVYREIMAEASLVKELNGNEQTEMPIRPLPKPASSLFGRKAELASIFRRIDQNRLVTVVGTGGVGKTRLGIAFAEIRARSHPNLVSWLDMASLESDIDLSAYFLRNLRAQVNDNQTSADALRSRIGAMDVCFIVDNAESAIVGLREVIATLLKSCPNVRFLCISRLPLHIDGEALEPIEPFATKELESGFSSPAAMFFLDRAQLANPLFTISEAESKIVASICRKLDGLPLTLEIAATKIRTMPLAEIDRQLDQPLRFLDSKSSGFKGRDSLERMLERSWQDLPEKPQELFVSLGIFVSDWSASAAISICEVDQDQELTQNALDVLVDHSLVMIQSSGRYRFLETIRDFAENKLHRMPELLARLRTRHSQYYSILSESLLAEHERAAAPSNLLQFEDEEPQFRQVVLRASEHRDLDLVQAAFRVVKASFSMWRRSGRLSEGLYLGLLAVEASGSKVNDQVAEVLLRCAGAAHSLCKMDQAEALFIDSEKMLRRLGLNLWAAEALRSLGDLAANRGLLDEATERLTASREQFVTLCDRHGEGKCFASLGYVAREKGDYVSARSLTESALAIFTKMGVSEWRAWCVGSLGAICLELEAFDQAKLYLQESLAGQERAGNREGIAWNMTMVGTVHLRLGELDDAIRHFREVILMHEGDAEMLGKSWPMSLLGEALLRSGKWQEARSVLVDTLDVQAKAGDSKLSGHILISLAKVSLQINDLASAMAYLEMAKDVALTVKSVRLKVDIEEFESLLVEKAEG